MSQAPATCSAGMVQAMHEPGACVWEPSLGSQSVSCRPRLAQKHAAAALARVLCQPGSPPGSSLCMLHLLAPILVHLVKGDDEATASLLRLCHPLL